MARELSTGPATIAAFLGTALIWLADGYAQHHGHPAAGSETSALAAILFDVSWPRALFRVGVATALVATTVAVFAGFARVRDGAVAADKAGELARAKTIPEADASEHDPRIHRHLETAIETVPVAFALYDAQDRLLTCNRLYRSLCVQPDLHRTGVSFEMLVRATAYGGYVLDAIGREEAWIAERMERHRNPSGIIEQRTAKGHRTLIEHRTPDGFTLLVIQDITDLRETEASLREALHEAQIANQAKTTFLANMSHELRTPLNCVIGFSDILADEMMGPIGHPKYKEYAGDIRQAGRDLLNIINDILDISRIEAGRIVLRDQTVSLANLLAHCARVFSPQLGELGLEMTVRCPDDLPAIHADEHRVRQVLFNLLSNAIKFTRPGGRIAITAALGDDGRISVAVADTGIGISEENLRQVLDLFVQVEDPFVRARASSGLGLPLSRGLMKLHGGELQLESRLGEGTTATILFPADRTII